jgi:hypothetical protein
MNKKWNSAAKKNPTKPGYYLAYHWYMDIINKTYWDGGKCGENGGYVTNWMDLPPKPTNATRTYVELGYGIITRSLEE